MLTSHTRSHGAPPTEPWAYGEDFMNAFRLADDMRYELMPYIYAQAKDCSERGLPMMRALFIEFPNDPGAWLVDDEYLFGTDLLVAPLFENLTKRDVYLPTGKWIDYQTGKVYSEGWHNIEAGKIPIVVMVRDGSVIPHIGLAQSTAQNGLVHTGPCGLCNRCTKGNRLDLFAIGQGIAPGNTCKKWKQFQT